LPGNLFAETARNSKSPGEYRIDLRAESGGFQVEFPGEFRRGWGGECGGNLARNLAANGGGGCGDIRGYSRERSREITEV
jgi:hypothetical protein